ncbi:hypothetical protein EJ05DRAFT_497446 [Pseudovirgaria hyperparasitica]|uniref:mRNA 3'-end-processing protein RNA14 n=1 Tax=Pseudovirgaria hyperparasitica TaxID=470096 RepID=A0A6A6WFP7_9PEZI|nr:uncharacterized protein EJ05DRAFT_497446 [Pseudovirgaria hyperparasitica]KAF2760874.1 hypothetical protein EJ05DRAFT_497446 [Pseudovirgaria hyperparasitica]
MTDADAELAFLQSMQDGTPAYVNGDNEQTVDNEGDEDYDPARLIASNEHSHDEDESGSNRTSMSGSMPQSPATPAIASADMHAPAPSESPAFSKQPRTVGGFVVDDDDEDEDETPVSLSKGQSVGDKGMGNLEAAPETALHSVPQTPINTLSQPDVPLQNAQDQDVSGALSIGVTDTVPHSTSVPAETSAPAKVYSTAAPPDPSTTTTASADTAALIPSSFPKGRLPQDRIGILEDRIKEDPRGDIDAYLSLIAEYRKRNKLDDARAIYTRFFEKFPQAVEQWLIYAHMELQEEELSRLEQIFSISLERLWNVEMWSMYLDYVRRRNNLMSDSSGQARQVITSAYEYALGKVGIDKDSGKMWQDYIEFLKSAPGTVGGTTWQDQQKMDSLRKIYQRAVCIPTEKLHDIWKQYDTFETTLNRVTGRKFLQERSPAFVTARSSYVQLDNITRDLLRNTTPRLPPMKGFDGEEEYTRQIEIWSNWIRWEKEDPLVLKDEDLDAYKARVLYAYRQSVMPLRFWPDMWFDAAEWCFQNDMEAEGNKFLDDGITANPENCLLAFKKADRVELTTLPEETDEAKIKRGSLIRAPYDKLLDALYELIDKAKKRQQQLIETVKERFRAEEPEISIEDDDGDDDDDVAEQKKAHEAWKTAQQVQIDAIKRGSDAQLKVIKRTISYSWIALMRAMRRVQGKGTGKKTSDKPGGFRAVFIDARARGQWTAEIWITSALMEYHYKDPVATKLFERAQKLFPDDELFNLEYLKHLINTRDITNARAVFETTVSRMTAKPENVHKAKSLFAFFHEYESQYGELSQIVQLEKRMATLFPEDPRLASFAHRYTEHEFDPTTIRHIISPGTQVRPKALSSVMPAISAPAPPSVRSPQMPPAALAVQPQVITNSPKRPFVGDDSDTERPAKFIRGESPLKGAAGRRLDAQRRNQQRSDGNINMAMTQPPGPAPLPKEINFLLSIIPAAHYYKAVVLDPRKMVELLGNVDLNRANTQHPSMSAMQHIRPTQSQAPQFPYGAPPSYVQPPVYHYTR